MKIPNNLRLIVNMRFYLTLCSALFLVNCSSKTDHIEMVYGQTGTSLFQLKNKQLAYTVKKEGQMVLDTSLLGVTIDGKNLGSNSKISFLNQDKVTLKYALNGIKKMADYKGNIHSYEITEADGFKWKLEFQLSNDGVAYRYKVPGSGSRTVLGEATTFKLPESTRVWYFERDSDWKLKSHAGEWLSADISEMPTVSKMGPVQGLTLTCELPMGGYALLAEAALYNYSGMRLKAIGNNSFKANFTEGDQGFVVDGTITTPWRCILLADDLNALANNTMVASLNPAPNSELFADTSWIKPGKSVWHWWSGKYVDFREEQDMVDDALALDFEYNMVDDGWEAWEDKWKKIAELCSYAQDKGVGIFVWKHSKEINFPENDYTIMGHFLDSVKQAGAVGVKVDFMNGQDKYIIDFDEALLRKAAERKLMVNFHGCQQSSGEYRTYPNEVTREGIRGLEVNHMQEGPLTASHNAALPFTRYVTGHGDYTPLGFTEPGETSWAHQLGTLIAFYSPFNCIAENTQFLLNNEAIAPALNFIKSVPTVWDETYVLPQSKIGELAAIARKKDDDWYLGILSSGSSKEMTIDLNFLKDGEYSAEILADDIEAQPINLEGLNKEANLRQWNTAIPFKKLTEMVSVEGKVTIQLAANGGAAIRFIRSKVEVK
ncbi:alpha-glucosidase [Arenibacter palladensis]|uniref:Alpha-glucosidase n=1 Tax=Arenibacter palladensis TaxID=237373 RepID=A0A1M5EX56_9FLAO|nr:glycoside hydrolase family 97 protein [Arenibacter palladensis]SHF83769.1 alpha-glucosidase [Arenibacter palladensis]